MLSSIHAESKKVVFGVPSYVRIPPGFPGNEYRQILQPMSLWMDVCPITQFYTQTSNYHTDLKISTHIFVIYSRNDYLKFI